MKAGIVIDRWKLPIFTRHLKQAGYSYDEKGELVEATLVLTVETNDGAALQKVLTAAATECARKGNP